MTIKKKIKKKCACNREGMWRWKPPESVLEIGVCSIILVQRYGRTAVQWQCQHITEEYVARRDLGFVFPEGFLTPGRKNITLHVQIELTADVLEFFFRKI